MLEKWNHDRAPHKHDNYYADDQANSCMDDKDQCDGKSADSSRKSMHSREVVLEKIKMAECTWNMSKSWTKPKKPDRKNAKVGIPMPDAYMYGLTRWCWWWTRLGRRKSGNQGRIQKFELGV